MTIPRRKAVLIAVLLTISLAACAAPAPTSEPTATPTATPVPTATATATATPRPTPRPIATPYLLPKLFTLKMPTPPPTPTPMTVQVLKPTPRPTVPPPVVPLPTLAPLPTIVPKPPPTLVPRTVLESTATPRSTQPTPTAFQDLCDDREQECIEDFEPVVSPIAWSPTIFTGGLFSADIRIKTPIGDLRWPPALLTAREDFYIGVTLYRDGDPIASIAAPPPANADWEWTSTPGEYEADTFRLVGSIVRVKAYVSPQLREEAEYACFWNGRDLVGCADLE